MHTEMSERTLLPAPAGAQLVTMGPDGEQRNVSTVLAFVIDRNNQIADVVTTTGAKLRSPQGHPGALIIRNRRYGDVVAFEGLEYGESHWVEVTHAREQKAKTAPRVRPG